MPIKHKNCDNPYIAIGQECKENDCAKCDWNDKPIRKTSKFGRNPSCTRHAVAKKVMERVANGFDLDNLAFAGFSKEQKEKIAEVYRLWSSTWIIPDLERLLEKDLKKGK